MGIARVPHSLLPRRLARRECSMIDARTSGLFLLLVLCGLVPPTAHAQIEALPRPDTIEAASFGVSVAIDDSLAVVGASGATTCGDDSGAVFVYERQPGPPVTSWVLSGRLLPRDCRAGALFGADVAISGSRVLVSAFSEHFEGEGENAAYVFERSASGEWNQAARLTGLPDQREGMFAAGVALDGNRAVVTTSGDPDGSYGGAAYVFEYDPSRRSWDRTARLTSRHDLRSGVLGGDVSLSGNQFAVAASTYFARQPGSAYVFRYNPTTDHWTEDAHFRDIQAFFIDVDLDDSTIIVGEDRAEDDHSGAATIYTRSDTAWAEHSRLQPSVPYESGSFGSAVSLQDGWALITGYDEQLGKEINIDRVVYVYRRQPDGSWRQRTILDVGKVDFGASLDLDDRTAIIGSVPDDETGNAYITRLL